MSSAEPLTLIAGLAPAAPVMRILSRFDRSKIEAFAEISVALLDLLDGDADEETCATEDDFTPIPAEVDFGPGCPIADPGGQCDEDQCSTNLLARCEVGGPGCPISDPAEDDLGSGS